MGVRKFRSAEEMPGPPALRPLDPYNLRIACGLSELARRLGNLRFVPGVRRHRSHDELIRERERREATAARAARAATAGTSSAT